MSDILWLVYLGDVAHSIAGVFVAATFITMIAGIGYTIFMACDNKFMSAKKNMIILATCAFLFATTASLIPSKQFFYIMAGAKSAELAISTTIGQKTLALVEKKLDEALEGPKK